MSELEELQRRFAAAVMQPLTRDERMKRSLAPEATAMVKPNARLTSFERLEIYSRQYWFRVLASLAEDFPGLRAIVGVRRFEALAKAYLSECPSVSFTLRNLGSRLVPWLEANPSFLPDRQGLALDMARLEWAHIEAFDGLREEPITAEYTQSQGLALRVSLQPYVRLLRLAYPVDDVLIAVKNAGRRERFSRLVRMCAPRAISMAVHRVDDSVYYKHLDAEAFQLLSALDSGATLEDALDAAFLVSDMPEDDRVPALQAWFANWAELGWLCYRRD